MKKLLLASLAVLAMSASAQVVLVPATTKTITPAATFKVGVTLDAVCEVTSSVPTLAFGTYSAFTTTGLTSSTGTIKLRCTRNLTTPAAVVDAPVGVVAGLQFTVGTPSVSLTDAGSPASTTSIGSAATYDIALQATMPAGQAGACAAPGTSLSADCANPVDVTRTITITY
jgi:hypothetical protein